MTSKPIIKMFRDAWADLLEESGLPPALSPDKPQDFAPNEGAKAQLYAMQQLADALMVSPGFTGHITANDEGGLSLTVARKDVSLIIPFECRSIDPETVAEFEDVKERFFYTPDTIPTGFTVFAHPSQTKGFAHNFAEAVMDNRKNWHDMTREDEMKNTKELIVSILADKVKASLQTQAALDYLETIKPKL